MADVRRHHRFHCSLDEAAAGLRHSRGPGSVRLLTSAATNQGLLAAIF
jgi:hypothetical protein